MYHIHISVERRKLRRLLVRLLALQLGALVDVGGGRGLILDADWGARCRLDVVGGEHCLRVAHDDPRLLLALVACCAVDELFSSQAAVFKYCC